MFIITSVKDANGQCHDYCLIGMVPSFLMFGPLQASFSHLFFINFRAGGEHF